MLHRSLTAVASVAALLLAGGAAAQTLALATDRAGTTYNAVGSGMAQIATENSSVRVIVRPFAGPDAYLDQLNNNEVQLATQSSSTAYFAYRGDSRNPKTYKNIRLLRAGEGGLFVGFIALKESDINKIEDLKGKRVASDFGGHAVISLSVEGALKTGGLSWSDVRPVPVAGALAGPAALDGGRVDATWSSLGMPAVREIHAKKGVRYLDTPNTPQNLKTLRETIFPGVNLTLVKANPDVGVHQDIHMINYDAYLIGHKDVDAKAVKAVLTALWDKSDALIKIHRGLSGFKREVAVSANPVIPYHPAAIEFYKEKGIWTGDADKANKSVQAQAAR